MSPSESTRRVTPSELTGALLRAARALAGIRADELASASQLGLATVKRAEASAEAANLTASNASRLIEAYAAMGIMIFARENGERGVAIKQPPAS